MPWYDILGIFCPRDQQTQTIQPSIKRLRPVFTSMHQDEWISLLHALHPNAKIPEQSPHNEFRQLPDITRIYRLIPAELRWPDFSAPPHGERFMQRESMLENGIQVILYIHNIVLKKQKDNSVIIDILKNLVVYHQREHDQNKIDDQCLYGWMFVLKYIKKFDDDPKKIKIDHIKAMFKIDKNREAMISELKYSDRTSYQSLPPCENCSPIQQIAFFSDHSNQINHHLYLLLKKLQYLEQTVACALTLAAHAHQGLFKIYPFTEGNGKLARALVNEILNQNDFETITIKSSFYGQAAYEYEQVCESNNINRLITLFKTLYITQHPHCHQTKKMGIDEPISITLAICHLIRQNDNSLKTLLISQDEQASLCLNTCYNAGWTPLHDACNLVKTVKSLDCVNMLLEKGADPSITNNLGKKPFDLIKNKDLQKKLIADWPEYFWTNVEVDQPSQESSTMVKTAQFS